MDVVIDFSIEQDPYMSTKYRKLSQYYRRLQKMYDHHNIHKDGIQLRPIKSNEHSAYRPVSRVLMDINSSSVGKSPSYMKNYNHFIEFDQLYLHYIQTSGKSKSNKSVHQSPSFLSS